MQPSQRLTTPLWVFRPARAGHFVCTHLPVMRGREGTECSCLSGRAPRWQDLTSAQPTQTAPRHPPALALERRDEEASSRAAHPWPCCPTFNPRRQVGHTDREPKIRSR
jgi:hypothetical protein